MGDKAHWEQIYSTKGAERVSWYQRQPTGALDLIRHTGIDKTARIIDVGGGASKLVDYLLDDGFEHISVLDIAPTALAIAKARLGSHSERVTWIEADITRCELPENAYDLWHDRAVFHFLTMADDRQRYVEIVKRSLKRGGHLIVASFALDGPKQCSGLDVVQYSSESLHREFGEDFEFVSNRSEDHLTPFDTHQSFIYCYCRKR